MNNEFYRVVKIIDDMNIVLNCGKNVNIMQGDKFQIYSKKSEIVFDPFTNESLGELRMVKATVQVIAVYEKMSVCQNVEKALGLGVSSFFEKKASLNIDPSQITGQLSGEDTAPIQIGDAAEKL